MEAGVAEKLTFDKITTGSVIEKVRKVLETPSYMEKMKIRSAKFRDQPQKPLDRAIWWIEFVLRNPSPEHFRSPVLDLGFFRSNLYDIFIVIFIVAPITIGILLVTLIRKVRGKRVSGAKEKLN